MLTKIADFIVNKSKPIFVIFVILALVCCLGVNKVNINYDFTEYLNRDTRTRKGLELMNQEFGSTETLTIMLTNAPEGAAQALAGELDALPETLSASFTPDSDTKTDEDSRHERINLILGDADSVALYRRLESELESRDDIGEYYISGGAASTVRLEEKIGREIPLAMLIAVIIVFAVLFLTSHSYIEPLVFMIVLIVSIIINMGTNFVFGTISFITFAVCAILQLALAMDYSIMLLHTYFEILENEPDNKTALKLALQRTFMPISSSALTTVSGLVSLMFMSFTIGFDIGIVLSKGILITMISVFTFMPSIILLFSKPLRRTMHRPVPLGGRKLGAFVAKKSVRIIVPILLIACIIMAAALQSRVVYTFSDAGMNASSDPIVKVYGSSNSIVLLLPSDGSDEAYDTQRKFVEQIETISYEDRPAVKSVMSIVTTGEAAIKKYGAEELFLALSSFAGGDLPLTQEALAGLLKSSGYAQGITLQELFEIIDETKPFLAARGYINEETLNQIGDAKELMALARRTFLSDNYSRMIVTLDIPISGEESERVLLNIISVMDELYPGDNKAITGGLMSVYDISHAFNSDLTRVNLITIFAIFVIVMLSFKSLLVPALLICVIQGAVWINFALSVPAGIDVFFMCYLICLAIQMGATIDYGILLTSNYIRARESGLGKKPAMQEAMQLSLPTIFTSGLILFGAGLVIGKLCSVYYIYSIGLLIASGACFSLIMVLLFLPTLLINLDKAVMRFRLKNRRDKNLKTD